MLISLSIVVKVHIIITLFISFRKQSPESSNHENRWTAFTRFHVTLLTFADNVMTERSQSRVLRKNNVRALSQNGRSTSFRESAYHYRATERTHRSVTSSDDRYNSDPRARFSMHYS